MRIQDILRSKGATVRTIGADETVTELISALAEHNVGALVVSDASGGRSVIGIVSERDVVRRLREHGTDLLNRKVGDIMTATVTTCQPQDNLDDLMRVMTDHRIRHVPVVDDTGLIGIVSIGDVVKNRIGELEGEREHLESYISGG